MIELRTVMPLWDLGRLCLWGALASLAWASAVSAAEVDSAGSRVDLGWQGRVVLGRWNTAAVELDDAAAGTYRLDVTATDPDGNLATFVGEEHVADAGLLQLTGRFQIGRPDGAVTLRVFRDGAPWQTLGPYTPELEGVLQSAHTQAEMFFVTVGLPDVLRHLFDAPAPGVRTPIHLESPSQLPTDEFAYDGVGGLLLAGPATVPAAQAATIDRWVRLGGRLYLSVGSPPAEYRASPQFQKLPFVMEPELISTRELTSLETYTEKTVRILPPGLRQMVPKISAPDGRILAGSLGDPVLLRAPHGFGQATLLGLDITKPPLITWKDSDGNLLVGNLLRKMTHGREETTVKAERGTRLSSTGVTEVATQLAGGLEHFEAVRRSSPWSVMGGLIAVMLLIGPLDFWLASRVWKRPIFTWISFPILLAVCAAATTWAAASANGGKFRINQLDIVDFDVASNTARSSHFVTLYSPRTLSCRVEMKPDWIGWSNSQAHASRQATSWAGRPEASFGGMYRSGSGTLQFQQAEYAFPARGNEVGSLPLAQWSTAALTSQADGAVGDLVEAKLVSHAAGRLSGTILHRLPGSLTDWFLAYAGRIYWLPASGASDEVAPLEAKQTRRIEQLTQRELRGYLTRIRAREDLVLQQANYDPLRRDLKDILPALTFHTEIGGTTYTGLTNHAMADDDFTPLMSLDRAILFGYLDRPAATVTVSAANDAEANRTTLIRIVLPVDRSKQTMREMRQFED